MLKKRNLLEIHLKESIYLSDTHFNLEESDIH